MPKWKPQKYQTSLYWSFKHYFYLRTSKIRLFYYPYVFPQEVPYLCIQRKLDSHQDRVEGLSISPVQVSKNAIILSNTSCSEYQTGSSQPFETLAHTKSPDQVILGRACVISQVQVRAYLVVTRGGLEPPMRESKSLVLPLHYRVILQRFLAGFCD